MQTTIAFFGIFNTYHSRLSDGSSTDCETVKWAFTHTFSMCRVKSPYFAVGPGYCPSSVQIHVSPLLPSTEVGAGDWMYLRHLLSLGNLPCVAANAATTPNYCFTNDMLSCLICSLNRVLQDEDL
jgi:hypothetical protein